MSRVEKLRCTGLMTDPNPHADAPAGAMLQADEAVFRRPGTAEPRPGFEELASDRFEFPGFANAEGAIAFGDDVIVQDDGTLSAYVGTTNYDAGCPPLSVRGEAYGDALYFCGTDRVRKLYAGTARTVHAGVPIPMLRMTNIGAPASTGAVLPQSYVAYRAVLRIVYDGERTVTSAVSARTVVHNTHATLGRGPNIRVYLPADVAITAPTSQMFVSVYRSKNASVSPSDALFLAYDSIEVTSTDVTNGYVQVTTYDVTTDDDLGASLYTNPSRETFARNNALPPACVDVATYAGSLFAASPSYPHRALARFDLVGSPVDVTGVATGIGRRLTTADATQGSAILTNCLDLTGVQVGMCVVVNGHTVGTPGVPLYVVAINGSSVTISQGITSASSTVTVGFFDAIHVNINDAIEIYPFSTHGLIDLIERVYVGYTYSGAMDSTDPDALRSETLRAYSVGEYQTAFTNTTRDAMRAVLIFEAIDAAGAAFSIAATHGDEYSPALALPTENTWTPSERPPTEHCVAWSKNEEPEHFLEGGYRAVGLPGVPVLRIFSTLDGLFILKARGDGIYRMTGFGERSGWRVEQISKSASLIHPNMACASDRAVYAWTTEGAVEISSRGVVPLSRGLVGLSAHRFLEQWIPDTMASVPQALYNAKGSEVIWGLPVDLESACAESLWIYNIATGAWSRWWANSNRWVAACMANFSSDSTLDQAVCLLEDSALARIERTGAMRSADRDFAVTISAVSGQDVTISGGSGWTPAVGDVVYKGTTYYAVESVTDSTHFTVDDDTLTTGACTAFEAFEMVLRWLPDFGGGPGLLKRFEAVTVHFESTNTTHEVTVTAEAPPIAEQTRSVRFSGALADRAELLHSYPVDKPEDARALMGPESGLGNRLIPGVTIRQALTNARISGVSVEYRDTSPRARRAA